MGQVCMYGLIIWAIDRVRNGSVSIEYLLDDLINELSPINTLLVKHLHSSVELPFDTRKGRKNRRRTCYQEIAFLEKLHNQLVFSRKDSQEN